MRRSGTGRALARSFILAFLALAPCLAGAAEPARLPATLRKALAAAGIPIGATAVYVQDVAARTPMLSYNASRPMNPASSAKLVTTYAALEMLGPSFTWKTQAYAGGPMRGDVLDGDLVLRGTGDPKLTIENFWLLLRALRERGLREIRGDLVLDHSYFAPAPYDPGKFDNEPARAYNVGPDALLVNFNAIRFHFGPDLEAKSLRVIPEPRPAQIELRASVALSDAPCGDWRSQIRAEFDSNDASARVNFSGTYPAACGENTWNVALLSHDSYLWGLFRELWDELGGSFKGGVRDGTVAPDSRLIYSAESPPLSEVVRDINKFSNNVMARQLFLTLSAEALHVPGDEHLSEGLIRDWALRKGIAADEIALENGAGLSRSDRISALTFGKLLVAAWHSPVMSELVASMPVVASDGTMRRRLHGSDVAGQAHIKTGTLAGVRTLAGYVLARDGRRFAVVFLVNHPNAAAAEAAQDQLLRWVYEAGRAVPREAGGGRRDVDRSEARSQMRE
ncbi:MAG TPA: D-alanyl-D-alanine carboxypeptidase/D-alanyl-D-alanine-endopeptidase [Burkholderiales bacterium]